MHPCIHVFFYLICRIPLIFLIIFTTSSVKFRQISKGTVDCVSYDNLLTQSAATSFPPEADISQLIRGLIWGIALEDNLDNIFI